jgi:nitrogen regulatory protein P-II 1
MTMKMITATIQPHMEGRVVRALHELEHFPGFTIHEVRGQGRGRGAGGSFKLNEYNLFYHKKLVIEVVCEDAFAEQICATILANAHTGRKGDGIVTVSDIQSMHRIRDAHAPAIAKKDTKQ